MFFVVEAGKLALKFIKEQPSSGDEVVEETELVDPGEEEGQQVIML